MIKRTEEDAKYHSYNGKSILNLPLQVPVGISIIEFLSDTFIKYQKLMKEFDNELRQRDVQSTLVEEVRNICDGIISIHKEFLNGKTCHAYKSFHRVASQVKHILVDIEPNSETTEFVRMRTQKGLTAVSEFYHVPFNKINLCKAQRFSIAGYPCFYIGYTLNVCKKEMGNEGTYIKMKLKDKITVVDLTWTAKDNSTYALEDYLKAWPLIAACYIVPFWCMSLNKSCYDICENFRQEYIIPQFYTLYIKNSIAKAEGLRYYTSRYENLIYGETEYMNIVLYPTFDSHSQCNYDMNLIEKFSWEAPIDL